MPDQVEISPRPGIVEPWSWPGKLVRPHGRVRVRHGFNNDRLGVCRIRETKAPGNSVSRYRNRMIMTAASIAEPRANGSGVVFVPSRLSDRGMKLIALSLDFVAVAHRRCVPHGESRRRLRGYVPSVLLLAVIGACPLQRHRVSSGATFLWRRRLEIRAVRT
jgi:hypothetical protein